MRDYREKEVDGLVTVIVNRDIQLHKDKVTLRTTADDAGKSLSLQASNIMIEIPLEQVQEIITLAERSDR